MAHTGGFQMKKVPGGFKSIVDQAKFAKKRLKDAANPYPAGSSAWREWQDA